MREDDIVEDVIQLHGRTVTDRATLDAQLEEIAQVISPVHSGTFGSSFSHQEGQKKTEKMVDTTAVLALERSASIIESFMTPRSSTWHTLEPSNEFLLRDRRVMEWFEFLNKTVFRLRYAPRANFVSQKHGDYSSLMSFGTGVLFTDKLVDRNQKGLRYKNINIGKINFIQNHQGIIDGGLRKFRLTSRQALQQFGKENLPKEIIDEAEDPKKSLNMHWFIHCVKPRTEEEGFDPDRKDSLGFPFTNYYVSETGKALVQTGGFSTFPYSISRYKVFADDVYGTSPAMMALPTIKVLNEEKRTVLKHGHRSVAPPLLLHDDGVLDTFSVKPDATNYGGVTAEGRALVHTLPVGNLAVGREMMEDEKATINEFFLISLFKALVDNPNMTATQVLEIAKERGALVSPVFGRQESESLAPMIDREIDLIMQLGLIPPMPEVLVEAKGEYKITYTSPLSRAQETEEAAGLLRTVDWLMPVINVTGNTEQLDYIDWDQAMPDLMRIQGLPLRWQRPIQDVLAKREERAEAAQGKQLLEAAPSLSSVIKGALPA